MLVGGGRGTGVNGEIERRHGDVLKDCNVGD